MLNKKLIATTIILILITMGFSGCTSRDNQEDRIFRDVSIIELTPQNKYYKVLFSNGMELSYVDDKNIEHIKLNVEFEYIIFYDAEFEGDGDQTPNWRIKDFKYKEII